MFKEDDSNTFEDLIGACLFIFFIIIFVFFYKYVLIQNKN